MGAQAKKNINKLSILPTSESGLHLLESEPESQILGILKQL